MTEPQRKDANVSHETLEKDKETLTPEELSTVLANDPPYMLNPKDYPNMSVPRRQLLAWQVHLLLRFNHIPITTLCELAGCSRSMYYEAQSNDEYLGHLVLLCRKAIGAVAPKVTRRFIQAALAGDTRAQERILQITGVAPVDKSHIVHESVGDNDGDMNDAERITVAQGFDRFISESRKQGPQEDQSQSVAGSSETPDSQEQAT